MNLLFKNNVEKVPEGDPVEAERGRDRELQVQNSIKCLKSAKLFLFNLKIEKEETVLIL